MKIAVVSESPGDEAAIKILIDAIVGHETELVSAPRLRPGGWPHVLALLPSIIKALHYRTDVEGIAVVVDSDDSPVHNEAHEAFEEGYLGCRLCELRTSIGLTLSRVTAVANRATLRIALGVAVPAIEAWYRCGIDPHVMEATWTRKLFGEKITYDRRSLKIDVYGSQQPGLATQTNPAILAP